MIDGVDGGSPFAGRKDGNQQPNPAARRADDKNHELGSLGASKIASTMHAGGSTISSSEWDLSVRTGMRLNQTSAYAR
jgi:hypothetical protein